MYNIVLEAEEKYNSLQTQEEKNEMVKDTFLLILLRNLEDYGLDLMIKNAGRVALKQTQSGFYEITYKNFKRIMKSSIFVNVLFNKLNEKIQEYNGDPRINIFAHFQSMGLGNYQQFIPKYEPETDTMTFIFQKKI